MTDNRGTPPTHTLNFWTFAVKDVGDHLLFFMCVSALTGSEPWRDLTSKPIRLPFQTSALSSVDSGRSAVCPGYHPDSGMRHCPLFVNPSSRKRASNQPVVRAWLRAQMCACAFACEFVLAASDHLVIDCFNPPPCPPFRLSFAPGSRSRLTRSAKCWSPSPTPTLSSDLPSSWPLSCRYARARA